MSVIGHDGPATIGPSLTSDIVPPCIQSQKKHIDKIISPNHYILDIVHEEPCYRLEQGLLSHGKDELGTQGTLL